jgi:DNA polymerase theta
MLDDDSRGYLLELMVTKLLLLQQDIQIIGMSATISVSGSIYGSKIYD